MSLNSENVSIAAGDLVAARVPSLIARPGVQLLILACAMAFSGFIRTAMSPLQEAMRVALSLSDNQMGLLQGPIIGIPVALAAIPLGLLIDRTSRARLLQVLVVLSLAGSFLTAAATHFGMLLFARALAGFMCLSMLPVIYAIIADLSPPEKRGRLIMAAAVGQVTGNSIAFYLGGALLAAAGMGAAGWRSAMTWLSVVVIPLALLTLALRDPKRTAVAPAWPSPRHVWDVLRPSLLIMSLLTTAVILEEIAVGALLIWSAPMLARKFSLAPDSIGAVMAIGMLVSGLAGPLVGGFLSDYCQRHGGPRRTVLVLAGLALVSVPLGFFAYVDNSVLACVMLGANTTILLIVAIMGITLYTIVVPAELLGLCMSVQTAVILFFSLAVAPITVSELSGALGGLPMIGKALSIVCVSGSLLAAVILLNGRRFLRR